MRRGHTACSTARRHPTLKCIKDCLRAATYNTAVFPPFGTPFLSMTLSFRELGCSKGGRTLFENVNAALEPGQWMHIAGANGVGKTSLLRMLCGLSPIEAGDILWAGQSARQQPAALRSQLCFLGHLNALQESLSVSENLRFACALSDLRPSEARLRQALHEFGLRGREHQLARHLSQGQKRRVALSRLTLSSAPLWVLDEPFVAMDDGGVRLLAGHIAQHLHRGGMAVLTSHQQVPIGDVAPQVLELRAAHGSARPAPGQGTAARAAEVCP